MRGTEPWIKICMSNAVSFSFLKILRLDEVLGENRMRNASLIFIRRLGDVDCAIIVWKLAILKNSSSPGNGRSTSGH